MRKNQLKELDIVVTRDQNIHVVLYNPHSDDNLGLFSQAHCGCFQYLDSYDDDLTYRPGSSSDEDIVKVYRLLNSNWTILESLFRGTLEESTLTALSNCNCVECIWSAPRTITKDEALRLLNEECDLNVCDII